MLSKINKRSTGVIVMCYQQRRRTVEQVYVTPTVWSGLTECYRTLTTTGSGLTHSFHRRTSDC